ncbi:MAG TPA: hypothetical protein PLC99_14075 [Verrucomicrobiota bacterium]|nr:hypothetical protein [Verrucomicrobiota bacterium]
MNLKYLGDAKDWWKGAVFGFLRGYRFGLHLQKQDLAQRHQAHLEEDQWRRVKAIEVSPDSLPRWHAVSREGSKR